jgi:hypothetical protein
MTDNKDKFEGVDFILDNSATISTKERPKPTKNITNSNNNTNKEEKKRGNLFKELTTDRFGKSLSQKELIRLQEQFNGRGEDFQKLSPQEKSQYLLRELQNYHLNGFQPLEEVRKEVSNRPVEIEMNGEEKGPNAPHVNLKAENVALSISSEGGRVIHFNNREALSKYREAINNKKNNIPAVKNASNPTAQNTQYKGINEHKTRKFE